MRNNNKKNGTVTFRRNTDPNLAAAMGLTLPGEEFDQPVDGLNTQTRCPVLLVVDTSSSMAPSRTMLERAVHSIYDSIRANAQIADAVEIGILHFDSSVRPIQALCESYLQENMPHAYQAPCDGLTYTGHALEYALDMVQKRIQGLRQEGIDFLTPYIFFLTDGQPVFDSSDEAMGRRKMEEACKAMASATNSLSKEERVHCIAVGIGDERHVNTDTLLRVSGGKQEHVIRLTERLDLAGYFDWMLKMIIKRSQGLTADITEQSYREYKRIMGC